MIDLKIKTLLKSVTLIAVFLHLAACTSVRKEDEKTPPNFVFIMVDDLGWSDLSYNGSKTYESPNVDKLASQGMVFSDFYSGGPVCSPTRASILTGKYTARTGITTYLLYPGRDAEYVTPHLPLEEFDPFYQEKQRQAVLRIPLISHRAHTIGGQGGGCGKVQGKNTLHGTGYNTERRSCRKTGSE